MSEIISEIKEHVDMFTGSSLCENSPAEQMAIDKALEYLLAALKCAEFDAFPGDGWAKWTRVTKLLSDAAEQMESIDYKYTAMNLRNLAADADPNRPDTERPDYYPGVR